MKFTRGLILRILGGGLGMLFLLGAAQDPQKNPGADLRAALDSIRERGQLIQTNLGSSNAQLRASAMAEWIRLVQEFEDTTDVQFALRIISKKIPKDGLVECDVEIQIDGADCKLEGAVAEGGKLHCIYECGDD